MECNYILPRLLVCCVDKSIIQYKPKVIYTLCKIWGFHDGDYEEFRLLGCGTVQILWFTHFYVNWIVILTN
jgi:hypothetical protein